MTVVVLSFISVLGESATVSATHMDVAGFSETLPPFY